jgi:hypothetical protein
MRRRLIAGLFVGAVLVAGPAVADVRISVANGLVSVSATDATVRQILTEWARVGQTRIVNVERVGGAPITIELVNVPEAQALERDPAVGQRLRRGASCRDRAKRVALRSDPPAPDEHPGGGPGCPGGSDAEPTGYRPTRVPAATVPAATARGRRSADRRRRTTAGRSPAGRAGSSSGHHLVPAAATAAGGAGPAATPADVVSGADFTRGCGRSRHAGAGSPAARTGAAGSATALSPREALETHGHR